MGERQGAIKRRLQHTVTGDGKTNAEDIPPIGASAGENVFDRRANSVHLLGQRGSSLWNFRVLQRLSESHEAEADRTDIYGDAERQTPILLQA